MTTITSLRPRTRRFAAAFIAALFLLPTAGAGMAAAWEEESLTEGWFLEWPSLAIDSADHTNVVYMRQGSDPGLFNSTNATGSFVAERLTSGDDWAPDVALDPSDGMHVAYTRFGDDSGIHYLTNESASWVDTRLTTGTEDGDPAIALDSNGKVHIVYATSGGVDPGVFYLTNASGDWVRTRLVSAAHDVGPDIAIDGTGRPHVIFARWAPEAPGLYYLTRTGSTWSSAARLTSSYDDWPALALDADGAAHIAFQRFEKLPADGYRGQLFVATNETGPWVFERLSGINPGFVIGPPAVAFDADDVFHVVVRESNPGLGGGGLRHQAGSIGAWSTIEDFPLYESGTTIEFPTMGFTSTGQVRVAYRSYGGQWAGIFLSTPGSSERIEASRADEHPSITSELDGTRHVAFDRANATGFDNGVRYGDDAGGWDFTRVQWGTGDIISGTTDLKLAPDGSARIGIREPYSDFLTNQNGPWEKAPNFCCAWTQGALVVDGSGTSHMAVTSLGGSIAYATDSSGSLETTDIHPDFAPEASDPAIAVDGTGRRHVLYVGLATTSTPGLVYISAAAGGAWPASTRLYSGDMGSPDVAVDSANKVHVAWIDHGSNAGIYYATNASGAWVRTRLSRSAADGPPTIAVDPNGKILVAFARGYWAATPGLYLATNRTGSWGLTLVSDDNFAGDPSLDVGSDGLADIAYASDVAGVRVLAETSGLASKVVASAKSKAEAQGYLLARAANGSAAPADQGTAPAHSGTTSSSTDGVGSKFGGGGFGR